jgi:hypothetical protein
MIDLYKVNMNSKRTQPAVHQGHLDVNYVQGHWT